MQIMLFSNVSYIIIDPKIIKAALSIKFEGRTLTYPAAYVRKPLIFHLFAFRFPP
jgi:hypothetical protein